MSTLAVTPGSNRTITRFVLGFAAASLTASCLPLLTSVDGEPFVRGIGRGDAFVVYGLLIAVLPALVLPVGFAVQPGKSLTPLGPLFALAMTFASLPLVVAAWISGVAWTGVVGVAASSMALGAVMLYLRRSFGERAAVPAGALGAFLAIALPALSVLLASIGNTVPTWWGWISPPTLCLGAAVTHGVEKPLVYVGVALCLWVPLFMRRRPAVALLVVLVVTLLFAFSIPSVTSAVTLEAFGGPWSRPQVPTPVLVTNVGSEAVLRLRGESHVLAADSKSLIWLAAEQGESLATVVRAGASPATVTLPFAAPVDGAAILLVPRGSALRPESMPSAASSVDLSEFVARGIAPSHVDAILVSPADEFAPRELAVLHRARALGVKVVAWGGTSPAGLFARELPTTTASSELIRVHPSVDDGTIRTLFAAPDWQAIDLTRLLWFLVAYHLAFGLAFILPVSLDSRKSTKVYLVSVGFIIVATAVGGRATLKSFFLRDNQVYTQSLTLVIMSEDDQCAMRQIRSYASMSGEARDIPVPSGGNVICYRSGGRPAPPRSFGSDFEGFRDVPLDRVDGKLLLRDDRAGKAPIRVESEDGQRFRIRPTDGGDDPFGLRGAMPVEAALVLGDGGLVPLHVKGRELAPAEGAEGFMIDPATRALLGRFAPPSATLSGALLIRMSGTTRPDSTSGFFEVQDRGAIVLVPLSAGR